MSQVKINHVAIVVEDVDVALTFWRDALGLTLNHVERNEEEAVQIAFLPTGESEIELLAPITAESGVAKYLAKKGAGLHHICLEVEHIEAVLARLSSHQIELINDTPKMRPNGIKYAFVHPKSTGGVLLELYELPTIS